MCVCVHVSARLSIVVYVCMCVCKCGHVCTLMHAYLTAFLCVCVLVSVWNCLIDKSVSLCVGPVDLGCHGDGNCTGPGNRL